MDLERPITESPREEPEIWHLVNKSGDWWHPIHIHHDFFQILSRNGRRPPPHEMAGNARKEVIVLGPNEDVALLARFHDYRDPAIDADKTQHSGLVVYGNDATGQWAAAPGRLRPDFLAGSVLRLLEA